MGGGANTIIEHDDTIDTISPRNGHHKHLKARHQQMARRGTSVTGDDAKDTVVGTVIVLVGYVDIRPPHRRHAILDRLRRLPRRPLVRTRGSVHARRRPKQISVQTRHRALIAIRLDVHVRTHQPIQPKYEKNNFVTG